MIMLNKKEECYKKKNSKTGVNVMVETRLSNSLPV